MRAIGLARRSVSLAVLSALAVMQSVQAQEGKPFFTPYLGVSETFTDNVRLNEDKVSSLITTLSPSVSTVSREGRINGSLQAAWNISRYSSDEGRNSSFLTLNGKGRVTAVEGLAYVDLAALSSRQILSEFGPRSADGVTGLNNLASTKTFSVTPYLTRRFGSAGTAEARYALIDSRTDGGLGGSSDIENKQRNLSLSASDPAAFGRLGWGVDYRDQTTENSRSRSLELQSLRANLTLRYDAELQFRLIGGKERNNYNSSRTKDATLYGVGMDWSPGPRTKVKALWEERFFGPAFDLSLSQQQGRFVFSGNFSRNISSMGQSALNQAAMGTYDMLMQMTSGLIPNPQERDLYVRQYMRDRQLPEQIGVNQTVLTSSVFLSRSLNLTSGYQGSRTSLFLTGTRSERNSVSSQEFSIGSDFENYNKITTTSGSILLNHSLTPLSSANATFTVSRSEGDRNASARNSSRSRSLQAGLSRALSKTVNGAITLRNVRGQTLANDYTENAIIGTIGLRF
ncbi:TIGR03016 family PEP-CTERM system-associated outer membrane protein [Zoogloea sp.]|uniref:TIGR03016 family PEP-CTERM system-associated outer membrane protein n=1 Tax=Zoogloea sp. TaxID=49181 RepID=UPI0026314015|nr:TIGR03016 family PEP-CTERM system-associated outer membrane protein [Zoogloea sp.]MDD3352535.1 TIGR03016 family PEP-CTERM system-associated outer membrane protein [Zoogloea sp.]